MKKRIELETKTWDLDWNRHVTSRTYERFGYEGRLDILGDLGHPIQDLISKGRSIVPVSSKVKFLAQQFSGAKLLVDTELIQSSDGLIHSRQIICEPSGKSVCDLKTSFQIMDRDKNMLYIPEIEGDEFTENGLKSNKEDESALLYVHLKPCPDSVKKLVHPIQIKFSDMNPFWTVTNEAVWKYFEEGRFLFFKEVVGFDSIHTTDTTTFFMGGEIIIHSLPEPGSTVKIESWIESMEKIRFYFRQDLVDVDGRLLASMKDEQLFIKLSQSRPCKVPETFLEITEPYRS